MNIFSTERLAIQTLNEEDKAFFIELLSAPEIIEPIPQALLTQQEIEKKFHAFKTFTTYDDTIIWGIYEIDKVDLIGICGFLTNNENQREIAYRFRSKYWGKGYGTEVTRNLLDYGFKNLHYEIIAADVSIENTGSVRILEKFFKPVKEFYNEQDKCTDRRYSIKKNTWLK